ncbi:MAG: LysR family transcriptional regulator [Roseibium album]|uniref:LysR family transcriptional regulator n=1 Tax=Roseibium album TaxID=311410 RepID=UPI001A2285E6|nr:LysR family transcriptional regulator [Roseibium album]MBG6147067.1 DNA-binding transcriptional LysR family regulator [Labrenzia sp. EL_142]MBG6165738.1 DNA-binding transcriptional LysR family regulator [Labrenzia sp. EL_195]MBG6176612.1 DNA-binding transcriptional LysR family regulator [Labrenzia sp. EL_132]MBG6201998.1 DNA-binding transcriptional LysR family regulator [Labrenzia sp. EL_13]MBG6230918.1 DNA-binding transcriptional LysR family regulator [Labrenzia sp. EL_208]MCR9059713.1 Ly
MAQHRHRLREMEALRALVTTGTTIGAARRLGVSQSSISRALGQLEQRVGRALFLRSSGRIEPSAAALRLNAQLDPLFETLALIEGAEWASADEEPLRLIVPPTLAHNFVISRVAAFLKQNPGKNLQLDIQATDVLVSGILDLHYDLGLTSAMIQRSGVTLVPWLRSPVVCAMPTGHPFEEKDTITPADLEGVELIEFLRRLGTRAITEQIFARAGVRPRTVAETATNMAALELVREGLGVTLLNPFPVLTGGMPGISVRPFDAPITYNTSFVLPSGRQPSELARQFMDYVKVSTPPDDYSEFV